MSQDEIDVMFESCMIDTCSANQDYELGICANAEAIAARCKEDFKVELENWRVDFCGKHSADWCFELKASNRHEFLTIVK